MFFSLPLSRFNVLLSYYGLVAQWTRARGYEPRCRGFESLLALKVFYSKILWNRFQSLYLGLTKVLKY